MILRTGNRKKQRSVVRGQWSGKKLVTDHWSLNTDHWTLITEKGLTLVEVLLAVSILALGISGVLGGYASSITTLESGQYTIDAVNLLKEKMAEVEIMVREKEEISQESERGSLEGPFQDLLWEWDIQPAEEEDLYALSLTVSSGYNPRKFSLKTYVVDKKTEEEGE